ncbi:MAG: type IV pilus assembly protein PilM [Acidobacteriales bacterium]|nr:type IV pilus assembly protein PilM [Terriglobales bacterium]
MFGSGSKALLGLDVGSSSVKAVELRKTRAGIELKHLGLERLEAEAVVDSMITQPRAVSTAITNLCRRQGIKTRSVASSMCGHSVIVKKISLPTVSDDDLPAMIEREAAQHIPFALSDVNLDYQVLSNEPKDSPIEVLLVAVKKDKIANYTGVLNAAGKSPAIMDLDTLALVNCYEFNCRPDSSFVAALLNVGASVINIHIVKGATPLFPRDVSVGGNQYTDSLQKEFELSFEHAEALKLGAKIAAVSDEARDGILQQVTEIVVLEIQKTFDFFRATAGGGHIEKMYLAGGSCRVPGLIESLRQEFSIPVELLNPFAQFTAHQNAAAELVNDNPGQFAVAVGLALRSMDTL